MGVHVRGLRSPTLDAKQVGGRVSVGGMRRRRDQKDRVPSPFLSRWNRSKYVENKKAEQEFYPRRRHQERWVPDVLDRDEDKGSAG